MRRKRTRRRAPKTNRAAEILDQALERLADQLDQGMTDGMRAYLEFLGRFHRYSFFNSLLILAQCPNATHVAGYRRWLDMGRHVRRGEKGIAIFVPLKRKVKPQREPEEGTDETAARYVLRGFGTGYVFNVSQTDGEDVPEPTRVRGNADSLVPNLEMAIRREGIELEYRPSLGAGRLGMSTGGRIVVADYLPAPAKASTLIHELAHELLHQGKQDRPESRTVRETEAEATAYAVCHACGLDTNTAASDYLALYRSDRATLMQSLTRIRDTATRILRSLEEGSATEGQDAAA